MQLKSHSLIHIPLIPLMIIEPEALKVMQSSPGIAELVCILISSE